MNISITTHVYGHGEGNAPTVIIRSENRFFDGSSALVTCDALALELRLAVGSPHHCRELAQQLMGAADALVDHAVERERKAEREARSVTAPVTASEFAAQGGAQE